MLSFVFLIAASRCPADCQIGDGLVVLVLHVCRSRRRGRNRREDTIILSSQNDPDPTDRKSVV